MTRIDITLYGDAAERFERIKEKKTEEAGTEQSRPQVVESMMSEYEENHPDL